AGEVGVCELRYRDEHERVAKPLIGASESEMKVVSLRSEAAIVEHRKRSDSEACAQQTFRTDPRDDSSHKRSQDRDYRGTRTQHQSGISRRVAEKRLQNFRD